MNEFHANPIFRKLSSCIAWLLIASLVLYAFPAEAQMHGPPPKGLRIMILSGEGALNNIEARTAREPIVEVQDENHKPVAGAVVLFTIHGNKNGASGSFQNNSTAFSTVTNANGIAVGTGFQPNNVVGAFQVTITASYGSLTASAVINENNVLPEAPNTQVSTNPVTTPASVAGGSHAATTSSHGILHHLHWIVTRPGVLIVGGIVVGAVIGTVILLQPQSPTQITAGGTTVGAPAARPAPGISIHFGRQ
ncbi:MAG: hypothetical protein ACP5M4_10660 [Acidobacteriaceae bacterium]